MKGFVKSTLLLFVLTTINLIVFQSIHASNGSLKKEAEQALEDVVNDIKLKVSEIWWSGGAYADHAVTVKIVVGPRGDVISADVVDGSGDQIFDRLAIETLFNSSPLPFPGNPKYYHYIKSFNFVFRGPTVSGSSTSVGERAAAASKTRQSVTNDLLSITKHYLNKLIDRVGVGAATVWIFTALIVLCVFGYSYQKRIRSRKTLFTKVNNLVKKAYLELNADVYFSHEMMNQWLRDYDQLSVFQTLNEQQILYAENPKQALECRKVFTDVETYQADRNDRWVAEELSKRGELFDSLEKYPLSGNQRQAILRNDNRVLTVAGAGTGKTSTVVGKVAHLLDSGWCKPSEILLMSFSRETVGELRERISKIGGDGVDIRTFHALGLHIIKESGEENPDVMERAPVLRYLRELLHNGHKCKKLIEYLVYYFYPIKYEDDFETTEEYNQFATSQNLRTLRAVEHETLMTLQREKVRSFQEVQIANWLYTNGIQYEYERQYAEYSGRYRPDFYLTDYDIYIEHFGINRDGSTRKDIDQKEYGVQMLWKRNLHQQKETTLVETFSYQFREGNALKMLEGALVEHGVLLEPMSTDDLRSVQTIYDDLKILAKLTGTFLNLFKSNRITVPELMESYPAKDHYRENLFLQLFSEILELYEADLASSGKIDFGDMILKATNYVESDEFKNPYKVIIVDEYQDISRSRAGLIDSLQKQLPDLRLLCVGDDWQSIYRFTGSDLSLMTNFEKQWDAVVRVDLDHTYRFNDRILEASSKFITKNPIQLRKTIKANVNADKPVIHISGETVQDALNSIRKKDKDEDVESSVLVLGRYNFTEGVRFNYRAFQIQGMTVHRSKGLEADYVIVNDMGSGKYGFPSQIREDPIVSMLLIDGEDFLNGEERRLFYVAITRAKKEVWLLESRNQPPSEFLIELSTDKIYKDLVESKESRVCTDIRCPDCDSLMRERPGKAEGSIFFGCIHYPRCYGARPGCPQCNDGAVLRSEIETSCSNSGCDHVPDKCPACETGILVRRTSDEYDFIGCSTYPDCRYTQQIN